jgi:chromosome segregation ATPase
MAEEILKDLDQAIVKIKDMMPIFRAFADMKSVLEFVSNNRGMIAGYQTELQAMNKAKTEMKGTIDNLRKEMADTIKKFDDLVLEYGDKTREVKESYSKLSQVARETYLKEKDSYIAQTEKAKETLGSEKRELMGELATLKRTLESLKGEYEALKIKFR